ncbi:hypothetical protein LINGRAHAP2_LOCUS34479 [Linum grandiflorum]
MINLDFEPAELPPGLQPYANPIGDLTLGSNQGSCLLRLIHSWHEEHTFLPDVAPPIHTLWIDVDQTRIQGYTEASHAAAVSPLLMPGTIYQIEHPFLIDVYANFRACSYQLSLLVLPEHLDHPVYENPTRPYFPHDAFSVLPSATIRHFADSTNICSDVVGRLVSISDPVDRYEHDLSFQILTDEPQSARITISFTTFFPTPNFSLATIAAAECLGPVICIFTALKAPDHADATYQLESTPASRILFAPFDHPFRAYFDMYGAHFCYFLPSFIYFPLLFLALRIRLAHHHIPVRLASPTTPGSFTYIQGRLPQKLPLAALFAESRRPANLNETTWSIIRIIAVPHHTCTVVGFGISAKYEIVAHCGDATATAYMLFTGPPATMLLKHLPHEYAALPEDLQLHIVGSLTNLLFVVELKSIDHKPPNPTRFLVQNLWDPVAAFY